MLGVSDPLLAFLIDDALAIRVAIADRIAIEQRKNPSHGQIPVGFAYETPDMVQ